MKLISVILPTYNRADMLMKSVNSVLEQTYTDLELIIVDDASTDDTEELVRTIKDGRVRYVRLDKNHGAGGARNEGVRLAKGEMIAFEDSDDVWHKDKLMKQMEYRNDHPQFPMIYTAYNKYLPDGIYRVPKDDIRGELEGELMYWLLQRNTIGAPTVLMEKEKFVELGGFDTAFRALEDWEFAIRFSKFYKIGCLNEVLVDSYNSEGGVSSGGSAYYEGRCKMVALYSQELQKFDIFDEVVMDLFVRAQKRGILESVKQLLAINFKSYSI